MTNIKRPTSLSLRFRSALATAPATSPSPQDDLLPSQIMPNLFVGSLEQTNRDTVNKLNISYILSLGLLPLISTSHASPASPTSPSRIIMPNHNTSKDFKIRLRSGSGGGGSGPDSPIGTMGQASNENKGVRFVRQVSCKCINIDDNSKQIITKFFDEALQFIEEARRKKCNILVHCLAGISRSPTIVIAYLMRYQSLRFKEAYSLVRQCRPKIDPNFNFACELMIYEKTLEEQKLDKE